MRAKTQEFLRITQTQSLSFPFADIDYGRGGEIRTRDPHNPIVVRYQAALRPDGNQL